MKICYKAYLKAEYFHLIPVKDHLNFMLRVFKPMQVKVTLKYRLRLSSVLRDLNKKIEMKLIYRNN